MIQMACIDCALCYVRDKKYDSVSYPCLLVALRHTYLSLFICISVMDHHIKATTLVVAKICGGSFVYKDLIVINSPVLMYKYIPSLFLCIAHMYCIL